MLACDSDGINGDEDDVGGYFFAQNLASAQDCDAELSTNPTCDLIAGLGGWPILARPTPVSTVLA